MEIQPIKIEMKLTLKIRIFPKKAEIKLIQDQSNKYISLVNRLIQNKQSFKVKEIKDTLPSAVKAQAIIDAISIRRKKQRNVVLKKPVYFINNQNYKIDAEKQTVSFPLWDGKCKRFTFDALITDKDREMLKNKQGILRVVQKSGKWYAQVAIEIREGKSEDLGIMGIDLGLKIPAVVSTKDKVGFFGNGRMNKYIRRRYNSRRKKLGKAKKLNDIKNSKDKESRVMRDINHKISRQIVNFAKVEKVGKIRMEDLSGIRQTTKTSRKNAKALHRWNFYQLQNFIGYKATLLGIGVERINPQYTSQICLICGSINKAIDRKYVCSSCGFVGHRDIIASKNIRDCRTVNGGVGNPENHSAIGAKCSANGRADDTALNLTLKVEENSC